MALVEAHVIEAVPLEENMAAGDVDLLDDPLGDEARDGPPTDERSRDTVL